MCIEDRDVDDEKPSSDNDPKQEEELTPEEREALARMIQEIQKETEEDKNRPDKETSSP